MDDVVQTLDVPLSLIASFVGTAHKEPRKDADVVSMHRMVQAYQENLLVPHEGKRVRRSPSHTGWGARFLGVRGVSMAPPEKTLAQMVLTMCLVKLSIAPLLFFQLVMGG